MRKAPIFYDITHKKTTIIAIYHEKTARRWYLAKVDEDILVANQLNC